GEDTVNSREQVLEFLRDRNRAIVEEHQSGVASKSAVRVLSVPRRTSGDLQVTPVSPFEADGQRYVVAGMGDKAQWALNARAAGWGVIQNGGESERVRLVEVAEADRGRILREF